MVQKVCRRCHVPKPLEAFPKRNRGSRDGRASYCTKCNRLRYKNYREADPDRIRSQTRKRQKLYKQNNPEKVLESQAKYRKRNRDKINVKQREYACNNREKIRDLKNSRRRRMGPADAKTLDYIQTLRKDPCSYCGKPGGTIDHIIPISKGGKNHWSNLTAACRYCNSRKADKTLIVWLVSTNLPQH